MTACGTYWTQRFKVLASLATQGYGVGNWYLYSGDTVKAIDVFERIIAAGSQDAFGYIAAEVELARLNG